MKSWVVTVIGVGGAELTSVDESSRAVALQIAKRASDSRDDQVSVRGLKGATKVTEFPSGRVIARFINGGQL